MFEVRAIDLAAAARLREAYRGHPDNTRPPEALLREALHRLESVEFLRWHAEFPELLESWRRLLTQHPARDRATIRCLIALLAMPEYQRMHEASKLRSPYLCYLGNKDGGLYAELCRLDPWLPDLLLEKFSHDDDDILTVAGIVTLSRQESARLESLLESVEICAEEFRNQARSGLLSLLGLVRNGAGDLDVCVAG